jgi:hypothetical protein
MGIKYYSKLGVVVHSGGGDHKVSSETMSQERIQKTHKKLRA